MDIYYTNETLYVNLNGRINNEVINNMQKKVFGILDDYEIYNLELRVDNYEKNIFSDFISSYKNKYNGDLKIK